MYRLLRSLFSAHAFDGEGSFRYGGRWSSAGTRIVYTSEHLSLAMLEYMVHMGPDQPPNDLMVACADVPPGVSQEVLPEHSLEDGWRDFPAPAALAGYGDRFVLQGRAALMSVPSVLVQGERNWLLNPAHPDFKHIEFVEQRPFSYDPRLLRRRA